MNCLKKAKVVLYYVVCVMLTLWIIVSFGEILNHNLTDFEYGSWNLFKILSDLC